MFVNDFETPHLLECRDEMVTEKGRHLRVRQGARPVFLGVVSGEARLGEVSRDVDQKDELSFALGNFGGRLWRWAPLENRV
jgi:hypothetical protein